MLRWTIRILLGILVVIAVAAVIVHFILASDWLSGLVLARVRARTGMDVTAESLSIGWGGDTVIRDATVKLPLHEKPLLSADRIRIDHTMVPLLILGRPLRVRSVQVDRPVVNLRQYESGRWNVQDAWSRLSASLASRDRKKGPPTLPQVVVDEALIRIEEPNAPVQTVGPLTFRAHLQGPQLWLFDLEVPDVLKAEGEVAPGGDWAHEVRFAVGDVGSLVHQLVGGDVSPIRIAGRWQGRVVQDRVAGTLRLEKFAVGPVAARGRLFVQAQADQITIRPQDLVLSDPNLAGREVRLAGGAVRIGREQVEVEQVAAVSSLVTARLNGRWNWQGGTGEFSGSLAGASKGQMPPYDGTFQASIRSPQVGRKAATVTISAEAETSAGTLNLTAKVEGAGPEWRQSQWVVSLPTMLWSEEDKQVDLTGARAELYVAWPQVRLTSLSLPGTGPVDAGAELDGATRQWTAHLTANNLSEFKPWGLAPLDVQLRATGDDRKASISELRIVQGARVVTAKGVVSFYERGFQDVRLTADWPAGPVPPTEVQGQQPIGRWHLEGDVFGRVKPLSIEMTGEVTGQNIAVGKKRLGRVEVPVQAKVDAEHIQAGTEPFGLLDGRWQLTGQYEFASNRTQVAAVIHDLSLEAAAGMAGLPLTSQGRVQAEVQLAINGFDVDSAVATGSWVAQNVDIPPLQAERARGKLRIANGVVRFDAIALEQQQGRAEANMEFRLDKPQVVQVELKANEWPVNLSSLVVHRSLTAARGSPEAPTEVRPGDASGLMFQAGGWAKLQLNVVARTAEGQAEVAGDILWREKDLARLHLSANVAGQTLDVQDLHAEALGGSLDGRARIPLDRWQASVARFRWQGIEPVRLQQWVPQFERWQGVVSGTLNVEQVDKAQRPPEPMRFTLDGAVENGRFGPAVVDMCRVVGYVGDTRLLINDAYFKVLDGWLEARATVRKHVGEYYGSVVADFNNLSLAQLVHVISPNAGEYIGDLSGDATLLASSEWDSFGGEARIKLTDSDLASNPIIQILYNSLSLRFGEQQPTGTGEVTVRFAGPSVLIPSFLYFNRGVEIRGAGRIVNVNRGAESPIDGFAVASTRVLKGISLPGIKSLDRLLASFQTGAASAKIQGTLDNVEVKVVPLPIVLGSFRRLLWAQLHE